jgi:hypothetical protein
MMNRDQTALYFMDHIRKKAPRYYPGFVSEQVSIQLVKRQVRGSAILYRFKLGHQAQSRAIFVKVPSRRLADGTPNGNPHEKPPLFPKTEPHDMPWLHYTALKSIYEYFMCLDQKELGAIRVLDYLPQHHAIFTEELNDPNLRELVFRRNRLNSVFFDHELTAVFRNVGKWLRMYQAMPKDVDVKIRHAHRDDFAGSITQLTRFLAKTLGDESFFRKATSIIIDRTCETLPVLLPLGLGHGDYAMRNILIGPNARVTVLDTFAKWRTPIYEDIGYFLNELKTPYPQVFSQGLLFDSSQLAAYESAFLQGYFDQRPVPYSAIRLYESLALLDKWSSATVRLSPPTKFGEIVGWPKTVLINSYFRKRLKVLLGEMVKN